MNNYTSHAKGNGSGGYPTYEGYAGYRANNHGSGNLMPPPGGDFLTRQESRQAPVDGYTRVQPQSFKSALEEQLWMANTLAGSTFVPNAFKGKPNDVFCAIKLGQELGLDVMQSVQSIYVINGQPKLFGHTVQALVRRSGELDHVKETFDKESKTAICTVKRVGEEPITRYFSMQNAIDSGLAGKQGPWKNYPARMCQWRARQWAYGDAFPDIIFGLFGAESPQMIDVDADIVGKIEADDQGVPISKGETVRKRIKEKRENLISLEQQALQTPREPKPSGEPEPPQASEPRGANKEKPSKTTALLSEIQNASNMELLDNVRLNFVKSGYTDLHDDDYKTIFSAIEQRTSELRESDQDPGSASRTVKADTRGKPSQEDAFDESLNNEVGESILRDIANCKTLDMLSGVKSRFEALDHKKINATTAKKITEEFEKKAAELEGGGLIKKRPGEIAENLIQRIKNATTRNDLDQLTTEARQAEKNLDKKWSAYVNRELSRRWGDYKNEK